MKEQIEIGEVPEQCSVSLAIGVIRTMLQTWSLEAEASFANQLQGARKDGYQRQGSKAARYRPDKKERPSAGKPKIKKATAEHKLRLRQYLETLA